MRKLKCKKCVYFDIVFNNCSIEQTNCNYRKPKKIVFKFKIDNDKYKVSQEEWLSDEGITIATLIKKNGKGIIHVARTKSFLKDKNEAIEMVKAFNEVN